MDGSENVTEVTLSYSDLYIR